MVPTFGRAVGAAGSFSGPRGADRPMRTRFVGARVQGRGVLASADARDIHGRSLR